MILTVAGPPTHTDTQQALHVLPLPQLIALFIHTRNWKREQMAERFDMLALYMERQALLNHADARQAQDFVKGLVDRAEELRKPEALANKLPPKVAEAGYEREQLAFLQPWKYSHPTEDEHP